jgi:hypothetical protein
MKKALLLILASSLFLLQGCGGGDDGGSNDDNNNTGGGYQGVSAPFARGDASRYILLSPSGLSMGPLSSSEQDASGGMTVLNTNQFNPFGTISPLSAVAPAVPTSAQDMARDRALSPVAPVQNIAGDASFAIGRWINGTVTTATGTVDTAGAYHYVAYQGLSAFPSGSLHCRGGNFTTPSSDLFTVSATGATGTADIVFSAGSGALSGSVTVSLDKTDEHPNGETVPQTLPGTLSVPSSMNFTGLIASGGPSAGAQLADAGNGAYALVVEFAAVTPSGARYIGVGRLPCTSSN